MRGFRGRQPVGIEEKAGHQAKTVREDPYRNRKLNEGRISGGCLTEAILPKLATGDRTIPVCGTFAGAPSPLTVTNMDTRLVLETEITATVVFAGAGTSTEFRKRHALCETYGGKAWRWFHGAGTGWVFDPVDGRIREAELHWAEEPSQGIRELRFNNWVD